MYIWNIDKLTRQLKVDNVNMVSKLVYLFVFVLQYATGLLVFQAAPTLYRLVFSYAKTELEAQAGHPSLKLTVYHQAPDWFAWMLLSVIFIGLLACWLAHCPGTLRKYIDRFICLNTPISMRLLFLTTLFFGIAVTFGGLHFINKLYALQQAAPTIKAPFDPFQLLWKTFTKVTGLKIILKNLALLERAQQIFKQINQFSYWVYRGCYVASLVATAIYFYILQKHLWLMHIKKTCDKGEK